MIDAGAEDFEVEEGMVTVTCALEDFGSCQKKLEEMGIEAESAELQRIPTTSKETDLETAKSVMTLVEAFEDDDDVQNVFHNLELTDEIAEALA